MNPVLLKIAVLLLLVFQPAGLASGPPHIVVVLADDLGGGDLGCYGGTVAPTPHLDRLAAEGIRFTRYYSASPICSPSRCGLLTGQFPARWNITSYLQTRQGNRQCGQEDFLRPAAPALPRLLKTAGYATAHIGKWHLGGGRDVTDAPAFSAYGYDLGLGTYESPEPAAPLGLKTTPWGNEREPQQVARYDRTRWMVDRTIAFLKGNPDKPCFVNLWLDDPHTPWVPQEQPARPQTERRRLISVLTKLDHQIGRLMDAVPENTLLIFASDNGPLPTFKGERSGGLRGSKLSLYEGGIKVPFIARWPGKIPPGSVDQTTVLSGVDLMPSLSALAASPAPDNPPGDGQDLSAALLGKPMARSKPLFWEYGRNDQSFKYPAVPHRSPGLAMLEGRHKLLINADSTGTELYDLQADPFESRNLAAEKPEMVTAMSAATLAWWKSLPTLSTGG